MESLETEGGRAASRERWFSGWRTCCSTWTSACESFGPHQQLTVLSAPVGFLLYRDRQSTCDSLSAGELSLQRLRPSQDRRLSA